MWTCLSLSTANVSHMLGRVFHSRDACADSTIVFFSLRVVSFSILVARLRLLRQVEIEKRRCTGHVLARHMCKSNSEHATCHTRTHTCTFSSALLQHCRKILAFFLHVPQANNEKFALHLIFWPREKGNSAAAATVTEMQMANGK